MQASWKHFYVGIAKLLSIKPWVKCFEVLEVKDLSSAAVSPRCGNTWWVSLGTCGLWFGLEACSLGQELVMCPGSHLGNGCGLTSMCDSICDSSCPVFAVWWRRPDGFWDRLMALGDKTQWMQSSFSNIYFYFISFLKLFFLFFPFSGKKCWEGAI